MTVLYNETQKNMTWLISKTKIAQYFTSFIFYTAFLILKSVSLSHHDKWRDKETFLYGCTVVFYMLYSYYS